MVCLKELEQKSTLLKLKKILEINLFIALCLLTFSPLVGLFVVYDYLGSTIDFGLADAKTFFVKIIGLYCLTSGLISIVINIFLYGPRNMLISWLKSPWNILFLVTVVCSTISFIRTIDYSFETRLNGYYYSREGYLSYLAYWGIYLAGSSLKKTKFKKWVIRGLLFNSALLGIFVILDAYFGLHGTICHTGRAGLTGTFLNPNHYGYFLCLVTIISLATFIYEKNKKWRLIYGFIYGINLLILNKSDSFGPFLAFLIGMTLFVVFTFVRKEKQYYKILLATVFVTIALAGATNREQLYVELPGAFKDAFTLIKSQFAKGSSSQITDASYAVASGRNHLWADAITLIKAEPVFGYGIDTALQLYSRYFNYFGIPHNEYLTLAISIGIPGAASLCIGNLYLLIYSIINVKKLPQNAMTVALGVGTYFISSMFGVSLPIVEFAFFMVLGMLNSHYNEKYQKLEINNN